MKTAEKFVGGKISGKYQEIFQENITLNIFAHTQEHPFLIVISLIAIVVDAL